MASLTRKKKNPSLHQLLAAVRELSPAEQRRLRDELAKMAGVSLVRPNQNAASIRRGRRLAKAVRAELATSSAGSLDETMRRLRGRSWS
jgi:hypothetical protein